MINKIIYLDRHLKSVTGGHKYNDAFEEYIESLSRIKIQSTIPCASKYKGIKKIFSPFVEIKHIKAFNRKSLIIFGDTSYKYHLLLLFLTKYFTRAKTTMIVHHFPFIGQKGLRWGLNKWLMCKYTSMVDSIIVPSPFTLDVAKELFPQSKIFYVPLPFKQKFKQSENYEIGNFLYVGTVEERKGLSYLIDAIALLKNKCEVKLNIVGKVVEDSYYEKLQSQIANLGLSNNVYFHGRVSDEQLEEYYQRAEIFTFPSLLEGYGIVLIESFNNGLPIICFNNTAMPYTVKHGINGLIAKNQDTIDLANMIEQLSGNIQLRGKLQVGIKNTVLQLKTIDDFKQAINIFYQYVCHE